MKILIVGGGSMGQAFARGLTQSENMYDCAVVEHEPGNAQKLEVSGVKVLSSIEIASKDPQWSDPQVCVIAVKPIDVPTVGKSLGEFLPKDCVVVSIAAGVKIATLQEVIGDFPIVRAMPNIAASELKSATAYCSADQVSETNLQDARKVLQTLGVVVRVSENEMNLVTAISGSGPAYFFYLSEVLIEAAKQSGMSVEIAHQLVAQAFRGAASMTDENGSFSTLREMVTSPGGTTQKAIESMQESGFEKMVKAAVDAAMARGAELDSAETSGPGKDQ